MSPRSLLLAAAKSPAQKQDYTVTGSRYKAPTLAISREELLEALAILLSLLGKQSWSSRRRVVPRRRRADRTTPTSGPRRQSGITSNRRTQIAEQRLFWCAVCKREVQKVALSPRIISRLRSTDRLFQLTHSRQERSEASLKWHGSTRGRRQASPRR